MRFAASHELVLSEKMKVTRELLVEHLPHVVHVLEHITDEQWHDERIKDDLLSYISSAGLKNGQILRPLRAMLTGAEASPGAFEMLAILGKEESLVRIHEYAASLSE
ncbi:MAG: hypothetical protein H6765_06340 [Candidatus Peribacteria bacterium]|nr:MAG: hypothetical protein H6765_06340 [Candidatus Peribacteria bacterium]